MVVGTPDNIANLDAGRDDAAFWRGVVDGTVSHEDAIAAAGTRPAFGWITGTPHGNEPAGGEGSTKELYELIARTDCANSQRLHNLDVFIQPVTAPDDRDHNVRTLAWALDPNRDRGVAAMPENRALLTSTATYPGLFFIDAHQQSSGYFFPPNEDAALNEISHFALDLINDVIGPGIQRQFNDQSSQYRNYNTYDLFVPEYGDTVPALIMGSAGMTYEKGTNESYGKQVYDHYLAMDATVNEVAARKTDLVKKWVAQWPEAVQQGQDCKVQGNSQVSPVAIDVLDDRRVDDGPGPERERVRLLLPPERPLGRRGPDAEGPPVRPRPGLQAEPAVTVPGVHRFGNFNQNAPGLPAPPTCTSTEQPPLCPAPPVANPSPALTETMTLPAGTLFIPMNQGTKHWIQAVLGENPFLPFPYFYDQTTWSYSLLRGFSGDGFLTQQLPSGTSMSLVFDPSATTPAPAGSAVYAFNTDSMAGLAMANQLLSQGASVSRGAAAFDSGGVHFTTGAALVDGTSIPLATLNADSAQWGTPVYGLAATRSAATRFGCRRSGSTPAPRRRRRTRPSTAPATGSAARRCTARRCTTSGEGEDPALPDRADHLHRPRQRRADQPGLHGVRQPGLDDRGGHGRDGAAELRQRRRDLHRLRGGRHDERPKRGDHAAQHVDASAGSRRPARRSTASSRRRPRPAGASTPAAGSTARRAAIRRTTRRRWSATGRRSRRRPRS